MHYRISPSKLHGIIQVPPSKSHSLRAILFGMLGKGKTVIHNFLPSPDIQTMIQACRLMGAQIEIKAKTLEIQGLNGQIKGSQNVIDAGNSGQVLRFMGALAALGHEYVVLTGDHSLLYNRPIKPLLDGLMGLGALAVSSRGNDFAPIIVRGPMQPGRTVLEGQDSQPVSGLLMAASFLKGKSHIVVKNPGEKPWIALTLDWFDRLGIAYQNVDYQEYHLQGSASFEGFRYCVPADFSSAAYPIVAALITNSEITLENIDMQDVQGDKALIYTLQKMGAKIEIDPVLRLLKVGKDSALKGMRIDINDFIDGITIMAVIGCFAEGVTEIFNGEIARHKESDRLTAIATELRKMGADIEERPDGLLIRPAHLHGALLDSHADHRIAMSLAVAALAAQGDSQILDVACVAKSFPEFSEKLQALGACFCP